LSPRRKRIAEIALAEERLSIERESLTELQTSIEDLLARVEASQTEDLNRLIDFYKNMKPVDAARIMDDLDIETTILILGEMKPRLAAPILAKVSPVRARAISKIILERSQLPGDQDLNGIRLR
jgi:flagellar motility protein MotE (MotC chaperone)